MRHESADQLAGPAHREPVRQAARGPPERHHDAITGLPVDPMFSATKAEWLLDHDDQLREHAEAGRVRLGSVDG
ncbi:hypothetical protein GCM10009854_49120 [Saccharopolyspora halophila]|uniref:Uncharacterized protein n=1 Tax=Saccharopolyspora halophila TaxID=405551 RepID=A0ABP5TZZ9_9PSEU